jgi:hypothetical protein
VKAKVVWKASNGNGTYRVKDGGVAMPEVVAM